MLQLLFNVFRQRLKRIDLFFEIINFLLQLLLSRWFKVDADTLIITSAALLCSPPFVPVVAAALNKRSLVVPGLTIGIVGYALGNYLGFLLSWLLGSL